MKNNNSIETYADKLVKLITSKQTNERVDGILNDLSNCNVYIYGAGNAGAMTCNLLKKINVEIKGFVDKRAEIIGTYLNKKVITAENELIKDNVFVIISFICSYEELESMKTWLSSLGYDKICYFHDIYNLISRIDFIDKRSKDSLDSNNILTDEQERIMQIEKYLCDERSKQIYYDFYNGLINVNPDLFSKPDKGFQYFIDDIVFAKGYKRFIDCGAFDGDTAITLKKLKGQIEKLALFEPEKPSFDKLKETIKKEKVANEQILFPCGVWDKTEMLAFKSGLQSSSSISESGDVYVQCIALDDVLQDFKPTFIKMDIEGAELEALLGAENMIREHKPDLAISVYHKVEHMIDIPLLIKNFNPNYKLYLRCHGLHGMETILYAVSE